MSGLAGLATPARAGTDFHLNIGIGPRPGPVIVAPRGAPVVVYFHGGGYVAGARSPLPGLIYDNVPTFFARNACIGVNATYRLAPAHKWPAGGADVGAVVGWLRENIAQYGGDSSRIFFWGKSTGASHIADYLAGRVKQGLPSDVAGAILTSGSYALGDTPLWTNYYGEDVSLYPERNALANLVNTDAPLLATYAEFDGDQYKQQFALLANAMTTAGKPLETLYLQNHSHMSETYAVGTGDESLTGPVLDFVLRHSGE